MLFDPGSPYRACLICGAIYQSALDRSPAVGPIKNRAAAKRQRWADNHSKKHSRIEHERLRISGMSMTPTAANKLAAFGLLPISDISRRREVREALLEANSMPFNDSEE